MLRPNMSLRIGYVNVQGLTPASWKACHRLLQHHFDYLFVAETWFMEHKTYSRDRRFIATTTPGVKNLHGRQGGGIYLLGSHQARSRVERVQVTGHTSTFWRGKCSVAGGDFPPHSPPNEERAPPLDSVHTSAASLR